MVLLVSYYTKLKPRGVYCLVWCLVCDFRYSPTLIHPDLPAQNAHNFFFVLHLTQNSSAMCSSDPKLSKTGLRSTGAFLVVSQSLGGDPPCTHLGTGGQWGLNMKSRTTKIS